MEVVNTNKTSIPTEGKELTELTAVLSIDSHKLYAVYLGIGSSEFVLRSGAKLNYREALHHFPHLTEKVYRK